MTERREEVFHNFIEGFHSFYSAAWFRCTYDDYFSYWGFWEEMNIGQDDMEWEFAAHEITDDKGNEAFP